MVTDVAVGEGVEITGGRLPNMCNFNFHKTAWTHSILSIHVQNYYLSQ